ncbi:MAG: hypothetical protein ANIMEMIM_00228 [Candidatus Argoarchaeum ethanivorans]|uniref:Uncharacterized protein n=1 Tax=Candidatus Argoarchaeum ethanivorans TaxID=2608793 RepID=A0A811T7K9_9EURY|nr:MAG: hypothetical protein ANIMEMIM_00228 [Candidatus Argoarchaeum ethanivorans]
MAKQDEIKEPTDSIRIEDARIGYQVATNLWTYEGGTLWSKFNAFLVANSIVLASIALSMTVSSRLAVFSIGMPVVGIILCGFWFLLIKRSFEFYIYWIFSAREIEEQHLSEPVQTISRGGKFADGKKVEIIIGGEKKQLQMSRLGRLPVRWVSYLIVVLFSVMYGVIFIINIVN